MFKGIIKESPTYIDAYMRLAYLARRRGDYKRALEYIEQGKAVLKKSDTKVAPTKLYCMKGRLFQDMGQLKEAYGEFHKALEVSDKKDSYARVGIANIHYQTSTQHRSNIDA